MRSRGIGQYVALTVAVLLCVWMASWARRWRGWDDRSGSLHLPVGDACDGDADDHQHHYAGTCEQTAGKRIHRGSSSVLLTCF